ncbi:MAG: T9SS type A sorting domain-containing protein, partial [Candidatus Fermentibacteraceae bacterium]|nr:T9SS type A sorting domain-containing protein [Candidatus Fermentibacteraceae bacterium]
YDIAGRRVSDVMNGELSAGAHSVEFDTSRLGSGVYFVRIVSHDRSATGRFVVLD